jgi:UDPglucose--hexose-1-phosphate uridylyltransferase
MSASESAPAQEVRQHPVTKQWVIIAPSRMDRPKETNPDAGLEAGDERGAGPVEGCPFCSGHEEMLPRILAEGSAPEGEGWQTRVVPNKFPALTPDRPNEPTRTGFFQARTGYGRQEVIIETPHHHQPFALLSTTAMGVVLQTYRARYHAVRQDDTILMPILFRNKGGRAGASLEHPHSQLIATAQTPPSVRLEEQEAMMHFNATGTCVYCTMLEHELSDEERIIYANDQVVAFVPYAAEAPFEMWLMPRVHQADFGSASDDLLRALADVLSTALRRLRQQAGNPDYNFYIRTPQHYRADAPHQHWYVRIVPRLSVRAGFEIGTGMRINPSSPEADARQLRAPASDGA